MLRKHKTDQFKLKTGKNVIWNRTRSFRQPHDKLLYLTTKFCSEFLGSYGKKKGKKTTKSSCIVFCQVKNKCLWVQLPRHFFFLPLNSRRNLSGNSLHNCVYYNRLCCFTKYIDIIFKWTYLFFPFKKSCKM